MRPLVELSETKRAKDPLSALVYRAASSPKIFAVIVILLAILTILILTLKGPGWAILVSTCLFAFLLGVLIASQFILKELQRVVSSQESESSDPRPAKSRLLIDSAHLITSLLLERNEAAEANSMLIERYQVLTENLAAAVIIRDPDGAVLYCSPFTEELTGYSLDEIYEAYGDFFRHIIHPIDLDIYERAIRVSGVGERFVFRFRLYHKQGVEIWSETRTVPIFDEEGNVISTLSISFDVTATVRYQQQIEAQNKDLEDFTYMISHDLKSPIHTIKGILDIINEDHGQEIPKDLKELLEHVDQATTRLETLVASVLEYARVSGEESKVSETNLNEVLTNIKKDYEHKVGEIGGKLRIASDLPVVLGDSVKLYQIFSNLVSNAIKYRDRDRPLAITIEASNSDNLREVVVGVIDTGQGIPEDQQESIFRPFQRAHGKEIEGSGIGLACVKKLLEKIGGRVSLESTMGSGSTFFVNLKRPASAIDGH